MVRWVLFFCYKPADILKSKAGIKTWLVHSNWIIFVTICIKLNDLIVHNNELKSIHLLIDQEKKLFVV